MNNKKNHLQPRWAIHFLGWFCPAHLREEIEGDLLQRFERDTKSLGENTAKRRLLWNVIRFFRPGIILRNTFSFQLAKVDMLLSYFKIANRHFVKGKSFALINVLGLSVGITAFLLIMQYVSFELNFDDFHKNRDEIYRVAYEQYENDEQKNNSARNFAGIRSLIKENFSEVKACTGFDRTAPQAYFIFSYLGKRYYEQESFYQMDSNFFRVFPSLLLKGDPSSVLSDPHNLVLSGKMAKKLFGDADPIGRKIENKSPSYSSVSEFVITGVLKDLPENSHFHPNFIALSSLGDEGDITTYWIGPRVYTYLTLEPRTDPRKIAERINKLLRKLGSHNLKTIGARVLLQPISDIHLRSNLHDELEPNGSEIWIYILTLTGIVVLLLAWINYVNMETARFTKRTKEVGVRRVVGSAKSDLALQFMVEYFCITMLASVIAVFLFGLVLSHFSYLTGVPIDGFQLSSPKVWIVGISLFFMGTIIAGIYPALFLLRINPIATLKGKVTGTKHGRLIRKSLMVVQFTASMGLVGFLLVISEQLEFMRLTNKKIDLERIVSIRNPTVYANDDDSINYSEFSTFKQKLLYNHLIKNVTSSSVIPGVEIDEYFTNRLKRNLGDPNDPTRYRILFVDYDFIPFYGVKLKAGRNYSVKMGDEENWQNLILNEKAMHSLGFNSASEAINEEVNFHLWGSDFAKYRIVGIVEDYHQEAIKKEVDPIVLSLNHSRFQQVFYSVKLNAGVSPQEGLSCIENTWRNVFPNKPFEYYFQDDYYDKQFKSELHFQRIFTLFSGVAIFIACLGILGLTLFEVNSRVKEISIRKIFGATLSSLIALLSKDYLRLLIISSLICVPLIYYGASGWLGSYPVRIGLNPLFFTLPILLIVVLVILVSSVQIAKATNSNPVDTIKYE